MRWSRPLRRQGVCWWCGRVVLFGHQHQGNPLQATREHLMPRSLGGIEPGNIVLACSQCNSRRSANTTWRPWVEIASGEVPIPVHQRSHLGNIGRLPRQIAEARAWEEQRREERRAARAPDPAAYAQRAGRQP